MRPSTTATSVSSHSRVNTDRTRPPRTTRSAGSSPRATARRRVSSSIGRRYPARCGAKYAWRAVDVLIPRTLDEALRLKAERPDAVPIQGGTDVMVDLNFDRARPPALLNLNEVAELRGWSRENGMLRLASGLTYTEAMNAPLGEELRALAEAARTVGGPQIRNRGTIGGNLATASPAGDALPPLIVSGTEVDIRSVRGARRLPLRDFLLGPKRNDLAEDELILGVTVEPGGSQTFMKVGPRNAMVIAVVSLALEVDGELRAAFGSAGPGAAAARRIDDVRGPAAYRRHALRVLTERALARCLA